MKKEKSDDEDVVHLNVPLFIRLLEFAREDAHSDVDLHFVAENVIKLTRPRKHLTMDDYKHIVEE
jgi:hypothetical protein